MIDEKKLIEEIEKIFETDEENIDCTLSDFAYHVFDCIKAQPKFGDWIPADEPPKNDNYILLSFDNFSGLLIGRYDTDEEGNGAYYLGDCYEEDTCVANDLFVNAWQPLPKAYKPGTVRKQTNADRVRSMSDEELACFMCKVKADYQWIEQEYPSEEEAGDWEEWLQSEVE